MTAEYDLVLRLTSQVVPESDRRRLLTDFAYVLGWRPSDQLGGITVGDFANAHLIVEHGLENAAVITFLRAPRRYSDLGYGDQRRLLTISYNNLVDWHLQVEPEQVTIVFNRTDPPEIVEKAPISRDNVERLRSKSFEQVVGKKPTPNVRALDDALIGTISYWKRSLSAEMGYVVPNESLSALFNSIMFVRAVEDHHRDFPSTASGADFYSSRALLAAWIDGNLTLRQLILRSLESFVDGEVPSYLNNEMLLGVFDNLDRGTVYSLLSDFYRAKQVPYDYDFSLMSKHALSRIYEHYMSVLRLEESPQAPLPLFPRLPEEQFTRLFGSVYTPQFIARFFARYLREQMPPMTFKRIRTADPACGSGIFLRTLLELQCDPSQDGITSEVIDNAFNNVLGLDVNENARQATLLSLALLYLVLTHHLPPSLSVLTEECIGYYQQHPELREAYDAVIANPPFVALETQTPPMRERVAGLMGTHANGRIDLYLAFLLVGLEMLKPGGYGAFVLPHSFLLSENASGMRKLLSEATWVRCLVDLSAIRVFEQTGSYVLLLILQKRSETAGDQVPATVVKCQDLVGLALQDVVDGRRVESSFYSIYDVEQETFQPRYRLTSAGLRRLQSLLPGPLTERLRRLLETEAQGRDAFISQIERVIDTGLGDEVRSSILDQAVFENEWLLLPPAETRLRNRFKRLPLLAEFLEIRQGFITGADDVFIVPRGRVPPGEEALFVPYLSDRDMRPYAVPDQPSRFVFYPYLDGIPLTEERLRDEFPRTWDYLLARKTRLEERAPVADGGLEWWKPVRPRLPSQMMRPKIVSPHLVLAPRFSLDREGRFAVSHAPFLRSREAGAEDDLLRFFVAVLNSTACYWYISAHSHVYRAGYVMLEPKTLKKTPVPDPAAVPPRAMHQILELVDARFQATGAHALAIERHIDGLVGDLYELSPEERRALGMED